MRPDFRFEEYNCRDPLAFGEILLFLEKTFTSRRHELHHVIRIASKIREKIEKLNLFIQQANQNVCSHCKEVCCISKHGYYTREDLIYIFALGLEPPHVIFGRIDTEPCQYLLENGCSIERWMRPSGCNWYFCDSLLDNMEPQVWYRDFEESFRDVAELWLEMSEQFRKIIE